MSLQRVKLLFQNYRSLHSVNYIEQQQKCVKEIQMEHGLMESTRTTLRAAHLFSTSGCLWSTVTGCQAGREHVLASGHVAIACLSDLIGSNGCNTVVFFYYTVTEIFPCVCDIFMVFLTWLKLT